MSRLSNQINKINNECKNDVLANVKGWWYAHPKFPNAPGVLASWHVAGWYQTKTHVTWIDGKLSCYNFGQFERGMEEKKTNTTTTTSTNPINGGNIQNATTSTNNQQPTSSTNNNNNNIQTFSGHNSAKRTSSVVEHHQFTGNWCCLPCYWLRNNNSVHKASLAVATLLVTSLLVSDVDGLLHVLTHAHFH